MVPRQAQPERNPLLLKVRPLLSTARIKEFTLALRTTLLTGCSWSGAPSA